MAFGGGTFTTKTKKLPGVYHNFVSSSRGTTVNAERGVVALPIALSWGVEGKVFTITAEDFQKNSLAILGYDATAVELMPFREIFKKSQKIHVYNLATGGTKAKDSSFEATQPGSRGNALKYVVEQNVDDENKVDITLYLGTTVVNKQTVTDGSMTTEYVNNEYVTWVGTDSAPDLTAGTALTGGTNGTVDNAAYQAALNAFEPYSFNSLVCPPNAPETVRDLYAEYTKRMRDKVGAKFQLACHKTGVTTNIYDYEGVVVCGNDCAESVYWLAGALAGCAINQSLSNTKYDGELTIPCTETQAELELSIDKGVFMFHKVEDEVHVLTDINTFVTFTDEKGRIFSKNQAIRVMDYRAITIATIFNKYHNGKTKNIPVGRNLFWNDLVTAARAMEEMQAIETYDTSTLTIAEGDEVEAVEVTEAITIAFAMEKLYITTQVA